MKNVLENFTKKDIRAALAIQVIEKTMPSLYGLIIDAEDGEKSLRSHLIHKSTSGENSTCTFTIHSAPKNKVIRFDFEIKGRPIIGSSWVLSKYITFIGLNLLGIFLDFENVLSLDECTPLWNNKLKCFTRLIAKSKKGLNFSMIKTHPSGVEIFTRTLNKSVLS